MNAKQEQTVKFLVGIATLIFLLWFFTKSGVIGTAMTPKAEEGKLGNPALAGALIVIAEILLAIGGAVIVMVTGLWRFVSNLIGPMFDSSPEPAALTADQYLTKVLDQNVMSEERRANLQHALIIAVEKKDKARTIKAAELLAGEPYLTKPIATIASPK